MEIDQELVKKALLVLNKIDVEIDFNSVGEFVENFVKMSNKVFITWGRIYGFRSMHEC